MDAPQWTGDDDRDLDPDPDSGRCLICGADEDEPCTQECSCTACQRARLRGLDIDPEAA